MFSEARFQNILCLKNNNQEKHYQNAIFAISMNGILYSEAKYFRNFVPEKNIQEKNFSNGIFSISIKCIIYREVTGRRIIQTVSSL